MMMMKRNTMVIAKITPPTTAPAMLPTLLLLSPTNLHTYFMQSPNISYYTYVCKLCMYIHMYVRTYVRTYVRMYVCMY